MRRDRHRVCFQKIDEATARWYDAGERVEPNLKRAEFLWTEGKTYALRSSPA